MLFSIATGSAREGRKEMEISQETCLKRFLLRHYGGWRRSERSNTFLFNGLLGTHMLFRFTPQIALVLCIYCIALPSHAQNLRQDTLTEVQVSAPKYPEKMSRTGKVVSIISSTQIQASLGKGLGELLQEQVGIQVVGARSTPGSNQEIYVRGANTGHVLLLVDGFPVNDPSHISQVMDWNLINLANIERIEILKGGQSTLYGSDAMAAVINLVTRKSHAQKTQGSVQWQAGGFGTFGVMANMQAKLGKNQIGISAQNFQTQGFSSALVPNGKGEADGFRQQNLQLSYSRPIGTQANFEVNYQAQQYQGNLDAGPFLDDQDFTSKAVSHSIRGQFSYRFKKSEAFFRGFQDLIQRDFINDSTSIAPNAWSNFSSSNYRGVNQGLEYFQKWQLPADIQAITGLEYRHQSTDQSDFSISSYGRYDSPSLTQKLANQSLVGIYATLQKDWSGKFGLEIGSRWNRQSTFGDFSTFSLNPYWHYASAGKLFFNYYTSFKTPSLYQLYSPYGNLNLQAERGSTVEIGLEQKIGALKARLVGFQNDVSSGIVFQSMDLEPYGQYQNIAKQKIKGLEVELTYQQKAWTFDGNYTYLWSDTTYSELIRRPAHQAQLRAIYRPSTHWQFQASIQYVGERKDLFFDEAVYASVPKNLAGYFWTELQVGYQMSPKIRWNLLLKNALNQDITELYGYTGQARNVQLTCVIAW